MHHFRLCLLAALVSAAAVAQPAAADLEATFTFPVGSSDLDEGMRARLDAIAASFRVAPPGWRLEIDGHSDSSGGEQLNASVSSQRAERVAEALVRRGVAHARLEVKSLGAADPAASNATSEGRALNRRVLIHLFGQPAPATVASVDRHSVIAPRATPDQPSQAAVTAPAKAASGDGDSVIAPSSVASIDPAPAGPPPAKSAPSTASSGSSTEPSAPVPAEGRAATPAPADAPVAVSHAPTLVPADRGESSLAVRSSAATQRDPVRFWAAVGTSAVAVASAAGAVAFFADSVSGSNALTATQAQLARPDLLPQSRSAAEAHASSLGSAITRDRVGAGVLGAVAVTAAVTAVVLWIKEAGASDAPSK